MPTIIDRLRNIGRPNYTTTELSLRNSLFARTNTAQKKLAARLEALKDIPEGSMSPDHSFSELAHAFMLYELRTIAKDYAKGLPEIELEIGNGSRRHFGDDLIHKSANRDIMLSIRIPWKAHPTHVLDIRYDWFVGKEAERVGITSINLRNIQDLSQPFHAEAVFHLGGLVAFSGSIERSIMFSQEGVNLTHGGFFFKDGTRSAWLHDGQLRRLREVNPNTSLPSR